jgi:C4-dicarboxylate-specific signal transduction histidine kinase
MTAVSDTVERASKLTSQLLAFARRQPLKPEVFDVSQRVRNIGEMLESVTGARIQVRVELPERPCHVRVDSSQFETALINIALNARDAMDGQGTLTLRVATVRPCRASVAMPNRAALRHDCPGRHRQRYCQRHL